MQNRLAIVIVVDGLRASALGTYGNTAYPTPHLDELASRALVAEWVMGDATGSLQFYQRAWSETPFNMLGQRWLVTDDPLTADQGANHFHEIVLLDISSDDSVSVVEETRAAKFFTQAIEYLTKWHDLADSEQVGGMLWIHCSGMSTPWDVPLALRESLSDEDDPEVPEWTTPPLELLDTSDPDELLGCRVAYAAQVAVLDTCLGGFIEAFESLFSASQKLSILLGLRGYALGEHRGIGFQSAIFYSENIHVPCLIVPGKDDGPIARQQGFMKAGDIARWLADWFQGDDISESFAKLARQVVVMGGGSQGIAIRTPAWLMIKNAVACELYAKPDDRWEVNDIASRCPEIVQLLEELLDRHSANIGLLPSDIPLADELKSLWR